jgi:hypothetical protein
MSRIQVLRGAVIAAVIATTASGVALAMHLSSSRIVGTGHPTTTTVNSDSGMLPGYANLTSAQKLDRALTLPGSRGVAEGVVIAPAISRTLSTLMSAAHPNGGNAIVTDYLFRVDGYYGLTTPLYPVGSTVRLEVPGGTVDGVHEVVGGAPALSVGEHVFVFVDERPPGGTELSGDAGTIGVPNESFIARVVNGFALWDGHVEDLNSFRRHFVEHPVPGH